MSHREPKIKIEKLFLHSRQYQKPIIATRHIMWLSDQKFNEKWSILFEYNFFFPTNERRKNNVTSTSINSNMPTGIYLTTVTAN